MTRIINHVKSLLGLDDQDFSQAVDVMGQRLSSGREKPFDQFVLSSISYGAGPLSREPDRGTQLDHLRGLSLDAVATTCVSDLMTVLPIPIAPIEVHLIPAARGKGGGVSVAPGIILILLPSDDLSEARLKRNIAHEYSHAVRQVQKPILGMRGDGNPADYTVREYLVFEGLAHTLAETLYPANIPELEWSDAIETAWWTETDLDARGFDAYTRYMGSRTANVIGSRIVKSFCRVQQMPIVDAHRIRDREIYWRSAYQHVR